MICFYAACDNVVSASSVDLLRYQPKLFLFQRFFRCLLASQCRFRPVVRSLSGDGAKAVVHAFISSRLFTGVADCLLHRLQSLQKAAARLVTGAPRREHITPKLRQLHWLPVRQRVRYKLVTLAFRSLSGQAPAYLTDDCQLAPESGRRTLRSAERSVCIIQRCKNTFADRSFAVAVPRAWNDLPATLRNNELTMDTFCKHPKTVLFTDS